MEDDNILDTYFDFDLYEETTKNAPKAIESAANNTESSHSLAMKAVRDTRRAMMAAMPRKETYEVPTCNYPIVKDAVHGFNLKPVSLHHNRLTVDPGLTNENWGDEFMIPQDDQPKYQHPYQDFHSWRDAQAILRGMVLNLVEQANEEQKKEKPKYSMTPQEKNQALENCYGYFMEAGRMQSCISPNLNWEADVVIKRELARRMWARVVTSPYPRTGYHSRCRSGVCAGGLFWDVGPFA